MAEPTLDEKNAARDIVERWGGPPSVITGLVAQALADARVAGVDDGLERAAALLALHANAHWAARIRALKAKP